MTDFRARQAELAQAMRDPQSGFVTLEEDGEERLSVYRSLFFNNIKNFIAGGFPVVKEVLGEEQWLILVREFMLEHVCETPYFVEISREFVRYLSHFDCTARGYPAFLYELAHYEWLEIDVSVRDEDLPLKARSGDLPERYTLCGLATLASYHYPVHQISSECQPEKLSEQRHNYVVYRDKSDDVQFMVTEPLTALLLTIISEEALPVPGIISQLKSVIPPTQVEAVEHYLPQTLSALTEKGIVVKA